MRARLALALAVAGAGCTNLEVYPFGGYAYDPVRNCLEEPGALDVIQGTMPPPCLVLKCWLAPDGTAVVTDAACAAPPDYQDETQSSMGPCPGALAAYAKPNHDLCPPSLDGGVGGACSGG